MYRGRIDFGEFLTVTMCSAHVAYAFERCKVHVSPPNRFCAAHHEDFKAAMETLDLCIKQSAEYRDKVRWGLQYRDGRAPAGVEVCDFPINHEQLRDTVQRYDSLLQEEVALRRKHEGWICDRPLGASGIWSCELSFENQDLISKCRNRRAKMFMLRVKLYYGWFATLLSLFGAGPSENDVE